jgi:hypothetical protein
MKRHIIGMVAALALVLTGAVSANLITPPAAHPAAAAAALTFSYSVKFVCGFETPQPNNPGEPPVKPGNYATEVNIDNYHLQLPAALDKQIILLVRPIPGTTTPIEFTEPRYAAPVPATKYNMTLPPGAATMDDCNVLWQMAGVPPASTNFMIGYLVIRSTVALHVDAVYTAEVGGQSTGLATGISENVVHIVGDSLP